MIDYIKGSLVEINPTSVVIEASGVGYSINIPLPVYSALSTGGRENFKLYISEIIREDTHLLYGFTSKGERALFELLMTVSGVGANSARMIMSAYNLSELRQIIATGNVMAMSAVKGIGNKTAQKILVDLKDKVLKIHFDEGIVDDNVTLPLDSEVKTSAVEALVMLGFNATTCGKVVDKILQETPTVPVESVIKQALKML